MGVAVRSATVCGRKGWRRRGRRRRDAAGRPRAGARTGADQDTCPVVLGRGVSSSGNRSRSRLDTDTIGAGFADPAAIADAGIRSPDEGTGL